MTDGHVALQKKMASEAMREMHFLWHTLRDSWEGLEPEVLTLRAAGYDYEEIGRQIQKSASLVGNILQRCRERLRENRVDQRVKQLFTS